MTGKVYTTRLGGDFTYESQGERGPFIVPSINKDGKEIRVEAVI